MEDYYLNVMICLRLCRIKLNEFNKWSIKCCANLKSSRKIANYIYKILEMPLFSFHRSMTLELKSSQLCP